MFKAVKINLETNHRYFAVMNEKEAEELGLSSGDRVEIKSEIKNNKVICELEVLDNNSKTKELKLKYREIGIVEDAFRKLNVKNYERINVLPSNKPKSVEYIRKKFQGHVKLKEENFMEILRDIVDNNYSLIETTFFVLACTAHPLDDKETIALTNAMVNIGKKLDFKKSPKDIIVDKHCIGGIPGNRTTMIVVPIVAAAGLKIPKTSSRSITSPSGTADTMEVLSNVNISISKLHKIVDEVGGCIAWGGGLELSPADDIIINVEHPLEIDSEGQMIASILSKKKSAGSTHVLIDIPVGETAKVKTTTDGKRLKRRFEKVGSAIGLKVKVILSDGTQPIGHGIGPSLEAYDVMRVLRNEVGCSQRLKAKAIMMAGKILEMGGVALPGFGAKKARYILESGQAFKKMQEIITAQGKAPEIQKAKFCEPMTSNTTGIITKINNKMVSKLAFILGAPKDKEAGLFIHRRVGDKVKKGEIIYELHSDSELKIKYAVEYIKENKPFTVE